MIKIPGLKFGKQSLPQYVQERLLEEYVQKSEKVSKRWNVKRFGAVWCVWAMWAQPISHRSLDEVHNNFNQRIFKFLNFILF